MLNWEIGEYFQCVENVGIKQEKLIIDFLIIY